MVFLLARNAWPWNHSKHDLLSAVLSFVPIGSYSSIRKWYLVSDEHILYFICLRKGKVANWEFGYNDNGNNSVLSILNGIVCIVWNNNQPVNFAAFNFVYYIIESRNGFETINEFQMKYYLHSIRYFSLVWYHEWSRHQDESSISGKISNWILFFFGNDRTMNQGVYRVWDACSQIMANWSRTK